MSGALDKLKEKAAGEMFSKLVDRIDELKKEQERTNELLEEILEEVKE